MAARRRNASRRRLPVPWPILALILVAVGSVAYSLAVPRVHAAEHPEPRVEATQAALQPPERYAADPAVAEVYRMVAEIPEVIDGLYCYCHCSRHADHRSLLTCFQDDHGANCDICLEEAHLAYTLAQQGKSLDEIRLAIDAAYGG